MKTISSFLGAKAADVQNTLPKHNSAKLTKAENTTVLMLPPVSTHGHHHAKGKELRAVRALQYTIHSKSI